VPRPDAPKTALVTGADGGLGRAMCVGLAKAGYRVIAGVRTPVPGLKAEGVQSGELIYRVQCDVSNPRICKSAVDAIILEFGSIDILINNAAIGMDAITPNIHDSSFKFYQIDEDFWRKMMDVNVLGAFRLAKLVLPYQLERGWGRIINITTNLSTMVKAGFAPYGPSKAAIEAASVIWAKELYGTGVTVNVLIPGGPADTRMIPVDDIADRRSLIRPEAMVPPLLWLVSQDANSISGRRYLARLWRCDLTFPEADEIAGAPGAWN